MIIADFLEKNIEVFNGLLQAIPEHQYRWKLSPDTWSLLEIVCHLYDEERDDFRFRTQWVLDKPGVVPPAFNPLEWVVNRKYNEQNYPEKLLAFITERRQSVHWLKSLDAPSWDNHFMHPKLGRLTASYFLNNWLAHDYMHIRQINRIKYLYLKQQHPNLNYAGSW